MQYWQKSPAQVFEELTVSAENGLGYEKAKERLLTFGRNVLAKSKTETLFDIFVRQFKSPLIYILIFAAFLVLLLKQGTDAVVILGVILLNALVGTIQEGKARNSLMRLRTLIRHRALVRRDGKEMLVSAEELVVGDILIIHEGDRVGADARIFVCESLKCDEAVLTGEAYAVSKTSEVIPKGNISLGDRKNMVFAGTNVVGGYGEAVVVATGFDSELGKISKELLETADIPLPLAHKINKLTHQISFGVLGIAGLIFLLGILRDLSFGEMLVVVIGLSVSIVPEGLPVAVTIVLARGVWRMAKAKAIVRHMAAVEAMGSANVLLVDKTGTLTTGNMVIKKVVFGKETFGVGGKGYLPEGKIEGEGSKSDLKKLLTLAYLAIRADVVLEEHGGWKPTGDTTEAAIAVLCRKAGLKKEGLIKKYKTISAKPFDSKKRYIEGAFEQGKDKWQVFVGAPEFISRDLGVDHGLLRDYHKMAKSGLRVVGVVLYGPAKNKFFQSALLGIEEELREDVEKSIAGAQKAGFRVVMMTGDYPETGKAIAEKVGIFREGDLVVAGDALEKMSKEELMEELEKVSVFARITPSHKLAIVQAFRKNGDVCAMTGDGVNDAPALQAADLGIALGSGTQVAKDSADIILTDDDFKTITDAISEGRSIYLTLKKVILYLFSTSLGEVLSISAALFLGMPLPLVAVQIIWLNFVTDGFLVVSLAQDDPEKGQPEGARSSVLFDGLMAKRSALMGISMAIAALPVFWFFLQKEGIEYARSMGLVVLSVTQWLNVLNVRSARTSIFKTPLKNAYLIVALMIVFGLQILAFETSVGNRLLHTTGLNLRDWIIAFLASTLIIVVEEIRKWRVRSD